MYQVDITNQQGDIFEVKAGKNTFAIEPLSDNLSPGEALLASLGSCMGLYTRRYLDNAKIAFQGFSLRLEAEFSQESPRRFKEIKVTLDLKGASLPPVRKEAFLKFIENCPIQNTLKGNPAIKLDLK